MSMIPTALPEPCTRLTAHVAHVMDLIVPASCNVTRVVCPGWKLPSPLPTTSTNVKVRSPQEAIRDVERRQS